MVTVLGNSSAQHNNANRGSVRHGKSRRRVFRGKNNSVNKSENMKGSNDENTPRFSNVDARSRFNTKVQRSSRNGKNRSVVSKSKFRRSRAPPHRSAFSSKQKARNGKRREMCSKQFTRRSPLYKCEPSLMNDRMLS